MQLKTSEICCHGLGVNHAPQAHVFAHLFREAVDSLEQEARLAKALDECLWGLQRGA